MALVFLMGVAHGALSQNKIRIILIYIYKISINMIKYFNFFQYVSDPCGVA